VTIRYEIHDIPANVEIERQLIELSEEESFEVGKSFELSGNKRTITFEHLYTNRAYYYRVTAHLSDGNEITASSQFKTAETPRIISTEGVWNMRDIGGTKTLDGRTLKQGLVYRGVELDGAVYEKYCITETGAKVLTEELGIRTEMDLRGPKNNMKDMLGSDVTHNVYSSVYAYVDSLVPYYFENYRQLFSDLSKEENYPVYVHCSYGKDRTGTVIFLLQLLLGVSEEDAYKEWELSILLDGVLDYVPMKEYIDALKLLEGDTMQEKVENHLISLGVTKAEIENIKHILIENYVPNFTEEEQENNVLENKKIIYDGDSICMGLYGNGGYAQMIANKTESEMVNYGIEEGDWCPGKKERIIIR
jgi:protein-tyrosine phosphatase